jgi:hypothetical protein
MNSMSYSPSFLEMYVGWMVALFWARWLTTKGIPWIGPLAFWGGGVAVLLAQAVAAAAVAFAAPGSTELVGVGRGLGMTAVVGLLLTDLVLTLYRALRPPPAC